MRELQHPMELMAARWRRWAGGALFFSTARTSASVLSSGNWAVYLLIMGWYMGRPL
jgi:hypothetical protein